MGNVGSVTGGGVLFTLPVGYRPSATANFNTPGIGVSGSAGVQIDSAGQVKCWPPDANTYSLSCTFSAA